MHNTVTTAWVKNVNKLRTPTRITRVRLSPYVLNTQTAHTINQGQLTISTLSLLFFTPPLSTYKKALFYLLKLSYTQYPQPLLLERIKKN